MKGKIIFLGIFFSCAIIVTRIQNYITVCPSDEYKIEVLHMEYKAVVIDKFKDRRDHNQPKVKLNNNNNDSIIIFTLSYADNDNDFTGYKGLLKEIEVGDSVFKPKKSLNILLKKKIYGDVYHFPFHCKSKNISNW
ncbi:hypothetical protein AD998_21915 [bacterium 336/3]|nr:hypothetical protein AD998_21915 [bacterium 336/3]